MGLEDQAAVKRAAEEHGGGAVVLLGTPDVESTQTLAQTVVSGDPSYAGPLAGVPLGLPVFHVFEPDIKQQIPPAVYEAQVALSEIALDREGILAGLAELRRTPAARA
jgi:betaine reductase